MSQLSDYDKTREKAEAFYKNIEYIHSPALGEDVYFSKEAFKHIRFKRPRDERDKQSQIMRFKLLPRAVNLIERSTVYQEYEERKIQYRIKNQKRRKLISETVHYWGLIGIIDNRKIKVVLRKIGSKGQVHFWSIVPAWTTGVFRDKKLVRTMKGDPELD